MHDPHSTVDASSIATGGSHVLVFHKDGSSRVALPASGSLVVGRGADADVKIDDQALSRRHLQLVAHAGGVTATDLGSHNGTRVNGEPLVGARVLASGDMLALGDAVLVVHCDVAEPSRVLLDAAALRRRLEEELDRAERYNRTLGVIAIVGVPREPALDGVLRRIDVAAEISGELAIIAPELDSDGVAALAAAVVATFPAARAGFACFPDDGGDAAALIATARAAAGAASQGEVAAAARGVTRLELGDRFALISDPAMQRAYALLRQLARSDLSVLVRGETGSGKELAAAALHYLGARAKQPFVAMNCAAVQDTLVESELFGHEKGAFTGATGTKPGLMEAADGGTLFLDEVGELSASMQAKLLRAIETKHVTRVGATKEREVNVRIIAATHRDLDADAKAGKFRQDLYFRLGGGTVHVPPLRERPRELAILAQLFLDAARTRLGREPAHLSGPAMRACARHRWPGNVRELKNALEYAAAVAEGDVVEPWHLPEAIVGTVPDGGGDAAPVARTFRPISDELRELEKQRMLEALEVTNGMQRRAAELIAMPLRTFAMKLKQYGISFKRDLVR